MNPKSKSTFNANRFRPAFAVLCILLLPGAETSRAGGSGRERDVEERGGTGAPAFVSTPSRAPAFAGSLWREGVTDERGMFADKRAKRVGDILTIIVQETASVANSEALKTSKSSKSGVASLADTIVKQFVAKAPDKILGKTINPKELNLSSTGSNDYTGGGEVKNSQTIATRAAVQVIDVLPNGNLVVEGLREISFSKERQFASLRGLVRAYDILPDNTVLSSNMADARIEIISEGTLTDAQKKGWLLRLNDKINPF